MILRHFYRERERSRTAPYRLCVIGAWLPDACGYLRVLLRMRRLSGAFC